MLKKKQKLSSNIYELKLKFSKIIMQLRTEIVSKIIWQFELKLIKNYWITETKVEIDLFTEVFFQKKSMTGSKSVLSHWLNAINSTSFHQ